MRTHSRFLPFVSLLLLCNAACYGATISGTVKGTDGAPFPGAFVEAQNTKTRITVIVLSDTRGRYQIEKLPAGEYRLQIRAVGFRAEPRAGVNLTADQKASYDFALQKGMVHWSDISLSQARQLWPAAKGKDLIFRNCSTCHGFQSRMASVTRDADGWRDRVEFMRTTMHFSLASMTDQDASDVSSYLTSLFGPESVLPKSPADMPGYKDTVRPFSSDALNIVYVEYDMPGPNRMPFSAAPDKDGYLWIPNFGLANKITGSTPRLGKCKTSRFPMWERLPFIPPYPARTERFGWPSQVRTRSPAGIPPPRRSPNTTTLIFPGRKESERAGRSTRSAWIPAETFGPAVLRSRSSTRKRENSRASRMSSLPTT